MQQTQPYQNVYSVYPGEFVPMMNEEEAMQKLRESDGQHITHPDVHLTELFDAYKIQIAMPGVKRGEIMISTNENILSVCAVHGEKTTITSNSFQMSKLDYECFERKVKLEKNIDTNFISAVYKAGILHLYIPKSTERVKNIHSRIVVY